MERDPVHERAAKFLVGAEGTKLVCSFCHVDIWPRVGGYWFLLLSPRGRVRFPGASELRVVLCSGCGRRCREVLEAHGFDPLALAQASTGHPE